ncbi:endonuclease/exonuclease/phosphatase family protein [Pontibacter sp. CAU 1760]
MKLTQKILYYTSITLGTMLVLITLLSLIYDVRFWFLKALDFPRLQTLIALLVTLVLFLLLNRTWHRWAFALLAGMGVSIVLQAYHIFPYTPLASKAVPSATAANEANSFSLLLANVWMQNKSAAQLLDMISENQPDLVLAMETNERWIKQLQPLENQYPHKVLYPLDNTYGMALYSKLPLQDTEIKFLNHEKVPSIHTSVKLRNGKQFVLHAVHPVPPKPSEHPDNVGEKEVALVKLGKIVTSRQGPTVVAGDFNDVAWSKTSKLFGQSSRLHDVRIGRGLYNSFDATSFIFRWPLDHAYVSGEFKVIELKRFPAFGSDHFPIYLHLSFVP